MITCKVIRKVSGQSTVVYNGRTYTETEPRTPQAAPQAPRTAAPVAVDVSDRIPWTNDNVRVAYVTEAAPITAPEPTPAPVQAQTGSTHRLTVEALLTILKPLPKKKNSYIEIRGSTYPVKTLYDLAKLANTDVLNVTIESEHEFTWYEYGTWRNDPTIIKTKQTPALIIRHGNTKSTLIPVQAAPGAAVWTWAL